MKNLDKIQQNFISKYSNIADMKNRIPVELYDRFNVKRGLRNQDGTGVLVGLTEIGEVHGYIMDDGEKVPSKGILRYRGIDLKDLVKGFQASGRFGFEETVFLLLFGYLPPADELEFFISQLDKFRKLPNGFTEDMILKAPSSNIMNKLARSVLGMYSFDDYPEDLSIFNVLRQSIQLIARFPTLAAYAYQAKRHNFDGDSLFIHSPVSGLSTAENFLLMIRPDKKYSRLEAEILDLCLVLHAEHGGGNNSAFTVHVVTSSGTDTYSAISAAVGSLKGPLHGGANIKVKKMMDDIMTNVKDWSNEKEVGAYISKILRKEAFDKKGLVYGMGHAVYTLSDPRAELLKDRAKVLAKELNRQEEYHLYEIIEKLTPGIFRELKNSDKDICANVDFYSGFVYSCLNIKPELLTPIFAISRISGWCAHRVEELVSGGRIIRPAYKSVSPKIPYLTIEER